MKGQIKLTDYKTRRVITNLLEIILNKPRKTIKNVVSKNKIDLSDYQQVSDFITNQVLKCRIRKHNEFH